MLTSIAFAQFEVGTTLMGGELGLISTADQGDCSEDGIADGECEVKGDTAITMDLTYGKFVKENLLIKANLDYRDESTNIMIGADYFRKR